MQNPNFKRIPHSPHILCQPFISHQLKFHIWNPYIQSTSSASNGFLTCLGAQELTIKGGGTVTTAGKTPPNWCFMAIKASTIIWSIGHIIIYRQIGLWATSILSGHA
ncbi:hypothetical protein O181_074099 [Austropuccinia psidii MF-1]|uniref:Uncharacterized protein n=1 Tax=Austropuccinia psidii MF-1 TaxID=1389203 RepID=A0A9Q3ID48_9BASI|nr:hypothetical protein [Austropuccinia psidii MF-1]